MNDPNGNGFDFGRDFLVATSADRQSSGKQGEKLVLPSQAEAAKAGTKLETGQNAGGKDPAATWHRVGERCQLAGPLATLD